ncbi:hypothetical protein CKO_04164 [Citrobacter koseri ATCC BAA-895]|uniref:Uncharacterized protein n=1 Tax=Citrobacter koseri (strain ATCC BAA-895 / CDC 4225-83 / SGSC4696) TaxID=290338 RepID=A8AP15_CITK8|nr:hypothetical protein CKO_04164 [Citrobacter koseri ATCC BAA-895]
MFHSSSETLPDGASLIRPTKCEIVGPVSLRHRAKK